MTKKLDLGERLKQAVLDSDPRVLAGAASEKAMEHVAEYVGKIERGQQGGLDPGVHLALAEGYLALIDVLEEKRRYGGQT